MYDVVVIGGGPGGYIASIRLSQLGKKVAIIEKEELGGTCTNKGCIPTKALLTSAHLYRDIKEKASKFGIKVDSVDFELSGIMKHMQKAVTMSRKGIEFLMKKNKIDVFKDKGIIKDNETVLLENEGKEIKGRYLILAQGSIPSVFPPFDKLEGIWTSDDVFKIKEFPKSLLIIGGGVIGVEFATFFSSFGVDVTIVELADHILPNEDKDVAEEIKKELKKKKVNVLEGKKVEEIKKELNYIAIVDGETIEAEKVLLAVGRRPNITDDIKELGVKIDRGVITDKKMKTNIDNIYAIGDIRGQIMLAHVAMYEGIIAAHNIAGKEIEMDYSAVPAIIFSTPEIASVGLREKDIEADKINVWKFPVSANGRARTMEERAGFAKVIEDKKTGKVLGVTVVSPSATDMIMEGVLAVKYGMTSHQVSEAIHPHPTLTETLLGAFEGKWAIHI
ncbi:dihydrolipoamide dehydrogenase [Thermosipho melanesiensis]|uniref:Dihydrolipoyl dehydrogenase n=2 Tax=Thermosipho melanesiensis TaxID=46541 RepID=A6LL85_THEM4|nr:dihydrolipoyl dehydrogenase [Thermosipho melanesiensis]ABR30686.1 dihydrolipoamide dehydrogenase [Thermosipho melanesiensis BI429]APT73817.1 dihydrolipoamide dehydrogenase [Thermosipho melanesiensis]OOC35755.1 dihydrolipoamide dehydrogenase [Thermosipho melanesiensis]OOC39054.1 dihydrolipoamide dehydrogenase [Thermosipho melanesiensis]OOC39202.1 dihydrolipoamide dehydrogenase [Thermosipho melanesiensis]